MGVGGGRARGGWGVMEFVWERLPSWEEEQFSRNEWGEGMPWKFFSE